MSVVVVAVVLRVGRRRSRCSCALIGVEKNHRYIRALLVSGHVHRIDLQKKVTLLSMRFRRDIQFLVPTVLTTSTRRWFAAQAHDHRHWTPVAQRKPPWTIEHSSPLYFLGSCFAETLSSRLQAFKFNVMANNHGIAFNPISLSQALIHAATPGKRFDGPRYVFADHRDPTVFHSWLHHSSFSRLSREAVVNHVDAVNRDAQAHFARTSVLFVTLGTAFVHYALEGDVGVVANCHKQPASLFRKSLLTVNDVVEALDGAIKVAVASNPRLQVVLTVSPVRHTKEGLPENARSKAVLLLAAHELVDKYPSTITYFPAYELFMDQLRDYRWYDVDMIHPSAAAQAVAFDAFCDTYLSDRARAAIKVIKAIHLDVGHRPTEHLAGSDAYLRHLARTLEKTEQAQRDFAGEVDFSSEVAWLRERMQQR